MLYMMIRTIEWKPLALLLLVFLVVCALCRANEIYRAGRRR